MSAVALQNLLDYLTATLSVSNRKWLAERLIKPEYNAKQRLEAEQAYVRDTLTTALQGTKAILAQGGKMPSAYDLLNEL